jgi:hypothetical protein
MFLLNHMSIEPEIIDISDLGNSGLKSSNFGPGIELLMNDRVGKSKGGGGSDVGIEDLTNLERELNDLSNDEPISLNIGGTDDKSFFGSNDLENETDNLHVSFDTPDIKSSEPPIQLGKATSENATENKTWDGYGQFNNIPMNPDVDVSTTPKLSREEMLREKFKYLRKLEVLEKKGVELTKKYTMESSLTEMMGEYEMIIGEKEMQNSVKFQGNMLSAMINGIEFLNNKFDPFDIQLDGWGEQFGENLSDYDEIFGELHEKYKSKAQMAPELKLVFQLAASGMMVHMTNTMFKSAMPNMDDVMRQNPDLMQQFQSAAVNSMGQTNPGFSGFMNNMMEPETESRNVRMGPPPAPVATQGPESVQPPRRPGFVDGNPFGSKNGQGQRQGQGQGISMEESFESVQRGDKTSRTSRPEMKGPSDINSILSGLKPKSAGDIPPQMMRQTEQAPQAGRFPNVAGNMFPQENAMKQALDDTNDNGSTISISELKEMQSEGSVPKRSKRRQKSDKNTISLDI